MSQLSFDLPKHKNGNGGHRAGHRQFSNDLRKLVGDLQAAETLRAQELAHLRQMRASVYREAKAHGIGAQVLRAVLSLQRDGNP